MKEDEDKILNYSSKNASIKAKIIIFISENWEKQRRRLFQNILSRKVRVIKKKKRVYASRENKK